ncbi:DUF2269 domain-containing protein [Actinomadura craniellae]|uniref:DUF2269 domain-containing protein n=1 Tax=Actinomadura craniellae TaxID=2231787 RepID=A0A365H5F8_9ACTN|nr:DUF2269 domain-containing protein [Actinomadura craniellae]RAY14236.1 DUF2269 domain-containing protein [Actinomadura craniellae]
MTEVKSRPSAVEQRFRGLRPSARRFWLTLHVGFAVSWLGVGTAMAVLSTTGMLADDLELRRHAYGILHMLDHVIVIPLVVLSIVTGLVISLGTKWGLTRNWWVLTKFGLTMGMVVFAAACGNAWVCNLAERTAANPAADAHGDDVKLAVTMVFFCGLLWAATALSIYKPWGRTPWQGRSHSRHRA